MTLAIGFAILIGLLFLVGFSAIAVIARPHPATALFTLLALGIFAWQATEGYQARERVRREIAQPSTSGPGAKPEDLKAKESLNHAWFIAMLIAGLVPVAGFVAQTVRLTRAARLARMRASGRG